MPKVPFGEWLPDQPALSNPGALAANNVKPFFNSYKPVEDLETLSTNALDDIVLGAIEVRDKDGNVFIYAGTDTKLYEMAGDLSFTDQSKAGGYTTGTTNVWNFTRFDVVADKRVVATNFIDPVQTLEIGGGASGDFADLFTSTLTPKAKYCATVREFLVLGHTNDATDGEQSARIWWSGFRDPTDMDPAAATQCDFNDFTEGGRVTGVIGGLEYGVIAQEQQISRMDYEGPPRIFRIYPVDRERGVVVPGSIAPHGRLIFYWSEEGFHMFNGIQSIEIGIGKVNNTFASEFNVLDSRRVSSAIDPINHLYIINFPGAGSTGGVPNKLWYYHWPSGHWSEADGLTLEFILKGANPGFTLEELDAIGTDIDAWPSEPFDSDIWKGGAYRLMGFDGSHQLSTFTGANLKATIDTGETQLIDGKRSRVTGVRPLIDGGTPAILVGTRERQIDAVSFSSTVTVNAIGLCPQMAEARYHRARMIQPAGATWTHAQGIEVPQDKVSPKGDK